MEDKLDEKKFLSNKGRMDVDLMTRHFFSEAFSLKEPFKLVAKRMELPAGARAGMHKHDYPHLSLVQEGKCELRGLNGIKTFREGDCISIPAHEYHEIKALTDVVWWCIHATTQFNEVDLDKVLISKESGNEKFDKVE